MNSKLQLIRVTAAVIFAALLPQVYGQVTSNTESDETEEEVFNLSPFEVTTENPQRYLVSETLAGTRVRTDLADLGASISVTTKEFLKDTGSTDAQDLLVYTTNTEVGGVTGNFGGLGSGSSLFEQSRFVAPNNNTRIRGLAAADSTRNYFSSSVPWDSYNTDAITISRGPNSVLFGLGSPAGIINNGIDQAYFSDAYEIEWTIDDEGSHRGVVDFNRVIIPGELAIRVEALRDDTEYQQEPAYKEDQRIYAAVRYEPKFLDRNGMHTTFSVTYEDGSINSNNPRTLPPVDKITPWFTAMNKATFSSPTRPVLEDLQANPWLSPEGIAGGPRVIFTDPTDELPSPNYAVELVPSTWYGLDETGEIDNNILGLSMEGRPTNFQLNRIGAYWNYSVNAGLPFSTTLNPYKDIYITDPSIFDFYNLLMDGPNKAEMRRFDVVTAELTQTFWDERLGLQGAWALEHYSDGYYGILGWGGPGDTSISVDINEFMPDGSPNPNVGRPMIESHSGGGAVNSSVRKNSRYTAFADLRASDFLEESWVTNVLGRHKFTGAYTIEDVEQTNATFTRTSMDNSYVLITGGTAPTFTGIPQAGFISYIGSDLRGANGAAGLQLSNIKVAQSLSVDKTRYWDSHWARPVSPSNPDFVDPADPWTGYDGEESTQSENPANYQGWTNGSTGVLTSDFNNYKETAISAQKERLNVKSSVFVWQGLLFGGDLVPTWSVRKDTVKTYNKRAPRNANGTYDIDSPEFVLSGPPRATVDSNIHSFSLVAHTPRIIRERLWGNTDFALTYNDSSNFQVVPGRVDLYNDPIPNPSGKTKEYGVLLTTWNNKLRIRVQKYETALENATLSGATNAFTIGLTHFLMYTNAKRLELGLSGDPQYSVEQSGYAYNLEPFPGVSVEETRAKQQEIVSAALAAVDDRLFEAWNVDKNDSTNWDPGSFSGFQIPSGITAITKSESEGWEIEVDFQPIENWTVTANASKTTASYTEVGPIFQEYVDRFQSILEGPVGELGYAYVYSSPGVLWGRGAAVALPALWNQFFYAAWKLTTAQEGTNLPEIRPWRFNLATNYRFSEDSRLRGWNIGGSYRWQDKVGIGYPVFHDSATDTDTFDVANPYYGPTESHLGLWIGYERELVNGVLWRIQLNAYNVGESDSLVPISAQPDGTPSAMRISLGQSFRLTNTLRF